MSSACRVDHHVALDRSHVCAANSANDSIKAYQFSNSAAVFETNIGACGSPPANDMFEETTTGTIAFEPGVKWRSCRASSGIGFAIWEIPNSIPPHDNPCRTKLLKIR